MLPAEHNLQPQPPAGIEALQEGRFIMAEQAAASMLRGAFSVNRLEDPDVAITHVNAGHFADEGILRVREMLALEAVGVSPRETAEKILSGSEELYATIVEEDETVSIHRNLNGIAAKFHREGAGAHSRNPQKITAKVKERFAASPGHRELARLHTELFSNEAIPVRVQTQPFDPSEDPLGSIAFLEDIKLSNNAFRPAQMLQRGHSPQEILAVTLSETDASEISQTETARELVYLWGKGAVKELRVNKETGFFTYAAEQNAYSLYADTSQDEHYETLPFIESECATELTTALDKAGLMFHPKYQMEMMNPVPSGASSDRNGSLYSRMSYELAKWVGQPAQERVHNLFVLYDEEYAGANLVRSGRSAVSHYIREHDPESATSPLEEHERASKSASTLEDIKVRLASIDTADMHEAAKVFLTIAQDAIARDSSHEQNSDLPVTTQTVKIGEGTCFDVAMYYLSAAGKAAAGTLRQVLVGDKQTPMIEKQRPAGANTFLSTAPLVFNGVRLPKGSLFSHHQDGWAFQRITPFAFDSPEDQLATGNELAAAYDKESSTIQKIGGACLSHLVTTASKYYKAKKL